MRAAAALQTAAGLLFQRNEGATLQENTILKIEHVSKFYPGVTALKDVSFTLQKGEVRALVGENGAGKSTLIKCIMGVERPDEGKITMNYNGEWVVNANAVDAQAHGVFANYQQVNIAPDLSIAENYFLGRQPKTKLGLVDWKKMARTARRSSINLKWALTLWRRSASSPLPCRRWSRSARSP